MADFHVKNDDYPLVSTNDELMIVHRNQLAQPAVVWIGAHRDAEIEIRSGSNRETVETAAGPAVAPGSSIVLPAGGKIRVDLPGGGFSALDLVSKISTIKGEIFVSITSFGEYDTYFKQVDVTSI